MVPVVERLLRDLGKTPRMFPGERLRGTGEALDRDVIDRIIEDSPMIDVFVLVVDRDCNREKTEQKVAARVKEHRGKLVACLAKEEVEVWMLALHRGALGVSWSEVRDHCDPKEAFAKPFLHRSGWTTDVGGGRKRAMRDVGASFRGLLRVCPEIAALRDDLQAVMAA